MEREPTPEWLDRESALDEVYMAGLGWFVHAFASTESTLFRLLVEKSGLTAAEGAAVFSGVRMKPAMDALNRLFEAKGMTLEQEALKRPFKQLSDISAVRDDILHYGTEEDEFGVLFVSNAVKKHLPERVTNRSVSFDDLNRMVHDLRDIELHFAASMFRTAVEPSRRRMAALYTQRLAEPWLYKPPPPPSPQGGKRQRPPKQKPPPRSSRR